MTREIKLSVGDKIKFTSFLGVPKEAIIFEFDGELMVDEKGYGMRKVSNIKNPELLTK